MSTATTVAFGPLLRHYRLASGLTQQELAERAGVGLRAISDLERGARTRPYRYTILRLANALGVPEPDRGEFFAAARRVVLSSHANVVANGADQPRLVGGVPPSSGWELRHNLPVPLSSFVGRERDVTALRDLLRTTRLLTLTGAGGIGKTRLALEVARSLLNAYTDGIWLVELAAIAEPDLLPSTLATVLGVHPEPDQHTLDTLIGALCSRQVLLVLDNCEYLVAACARLTRTLLEACPGVTILVTSRQRLGTSGELIWRVPSLATLSGDDRPSVEGMLDYAAVRLFVERARAVESRFALTPNNAGAVARICERLDGIPLAIELAAAQVRVLTAEQIARRLDDRFALLTGGDPSDIPRHATLRATVDWSHDLLDERERILFRRLAVFVGGWSVEAAETVCGTTGIAATEVLGLLTRLVDQSLVLVDLGADHSWYRFLETIRLYARERLEQAEETQIVQWRHRQFYLALAEQAEFEVWKAEQVEWLHRLELEHDNIRAALRESLETDPEAGLCLAASLWRFWCDREQHWEARNWLESLLATASEAAPARGRALYALGMVTLYRGDDLVARSAFEGCLPLLRASGDWPRLAHALVHLGWAARLAGDNIRARAVLEEGVAMARGVGAHLAPNVARAFGAANIGLAYLGDLELAEGRPDRAEQLWVESLDLCRQVGDRRGWGYVLFRLGALVRARGELDRARELLDASLALRWKIGHGGGVRTTLREQAALAQSQGDDLRCVRLLAASEQVFTRAPRSWVTPPDVEALLGRAREHVGGDSVDRAWAEGQAMALEQVVAYALEEDRM